MDVRTLDANKKSLELVFLLIKKENVEDIPNDWKSSLIIPIRKSPRYLTYIHLYQYKCHTGYPMGYNLPFPSISNNHADRYFDLNPTRHAQNLNRYPLKSSDEYIYINTNKYRLGQ